MSSDTPRVPLATYRIQLTSDFGFDEAARIVDYLAALGISHLYCSPYLQAAEGSAHGYDVVDHTRLSAELGGDEAHARFCEALAGRGMNHILDIVPNHMAVSGRANAWWDVLKNGPESRYARFFDVDWDPPERRLAGKVLVPVLGDQYGRVLERGEITVEEAEGEPVVRYFHHVYPIAPGTLEAMPGDRTAAEAIAGVNSDPGLLHSLLESQHYRLAFWKTDLELNYRRFFDINELVALRVEEPEVFATVHELPLRLAAEGKLDGLRIDHVDGLRRPRAYLESLRDKAPDLYLIVEKILEPDETLPDDWPVHGTTGYDFMNLLGGLFVDPRGEGPLSELYADLAGGAPDTAAMVLEAKHLVMQELLASDVDRLTQAFIEVAERHPRHRDYTRPELRQAIKETMASLQVYRTYVDAEDDFVSKEDIHYVEDATAAARDRRDDLDDDLFEFLAGILLLRHPGVAEADLAMRFQQSSGPVMAKAVEDTHFYRYLRFAALNEVGGDPEVFGVSPDAFHNANRRRSEKWPLSMLSTSTHDTKRSEDVRARLYLLSEIPAKWGEAVKRWRQTNERHRTGVWPDGPTEYLIYQSLVGAHPLGAERAVAYILKAVREAKLHTSWTSADVAYERAVKRFVEGILGDEGFTRDLAGFVAPLIEPGRINSLAMTLLKLTAPGVPDIYQGAEVWDLSLVDPDNRRPVDYERRRELLDFVSRASPEDIVARGDEGAPKLHLIRMALGLRARRRSTFGADSTYEPLEVTGTGAEHLVAFRRGEDVAVVVPRLVLSRPAGWQSAAVALPPGRWKNLLAGAEIDDPSACALLGTFPVALLERS